MSLKLKAIILFAFFSVLLGWTDCALGQRQSGRVYEFLNLPSTARITATGGMAFPSSSGDLGMALFYPSLLRADLSNHLSMNFVDYFDDINYGTVAFARHFQELGTFSLAMNYISYGQFDGRDYIGEPTGTFSAGEYALQFGWGRQLHPNWSLGSNIKMIYSSLEEYQSFGLALDVSFSYFNEDNGWAGALVARHMGRQLTSHHENNNESLPFDLVLGVSKSLANAPFSFSVVANHLHGFNLTHTSVPLWNAPTDHQIQQTSFGDRLMRHLAFGMEFQPLSSFTFRAGYNYRRRQEMKVDSRPSTVGLSWGFGFRVYRFHFNYGRSNYHLAGAPNHISLSTSLNDLFSRPSGPVIEP